MIVLLVRSHLLLQHLERGGEGGRLEGGEERKHPVLQVWRLDLQALPNVMAVTVSFDFDLLPIMAFDFSRLKHFEIV